MIIIKLSGGLGNQLFQLAFGLEMSRESEFNLKLDTEELLYDPLRKYALDVLPIDLVKAKKHEIIKIKKGTFKDMILNLLSYSRNYYAQPMIKEKSFNFDSNFSFFRTDSVYYEGYWQSEKYFKNSKHQIRSLFQKIDRSKRIEYFLGSNEDYMLISMHYRRGDYAENLETTKYHGMPDSKYYSKALQYISERQNNLKVLVFSDDKDWVTKSVKLPITFEIIEGLEDIEELILMSHCKHNIIANSTFSWWGAWLNENPEKIVIAPKRWFANEEMEAQTQDLIPETWIRM